MILQQHNTPLHQVTDIPYRMTRHRPYSFLAQDYYMAKPREMSLCGNYSQPRGGRCLRV